MPTAETVIQSVSRTKGAIGYAGLVYLNKRVKAIAIAYDENNYILRTMKNGTNKLYPIVRPLYYYNKT